MVAWDILGTQVFVGWRNEWMNSVSPHNWLTLKSKNQYWCVRVYVRHISNFNFVPFTLDPKIQPNPSEVKPRPSQDNQTVWKFGLPYVSLQNLLGNTSIDSLCNLVPEHWQILQALMFSSNGGGNRWPIVYFAGLIQTLTEFRWLRNQLQVNGIVVPPNTGVVVGWAGIRSQRSVYLITPAWGQKETNKTCVLSNSFTGMTT